MHIYSFTDYPEPDAPATYFGTMGEAHAKAKELEPVWRCNCRIRLLDVPVDKAGILDILAYGGPHKRWENNGVALKPLREWKLTARGGLVELTAEAATAE